MFRLYVKWPRQKQFKPVNWREGLQVGNLIYATQFSAEDREKVERDLQATREQNAGMAWEWRTV
jgi:hypothetical protein